MKARATLPDSPPTYQVVYAYEKLGLSDDEPHPRSGASMTYGPNIPVPRTPGTPESETPEAPSVGRVYVMNEQGATLARYIL